MEKILCLFTFVMIFKSNSGAIINNFQLNSGFFNSLTTVKNGSACQNSKLKMKCPFKTHIIIKEAMYGRKLPSSKMCPFSANSFVSLNNLSDIDEDLSCEALTSLKKTVSECDGKRICQLLVHPRIFGNDPCPGTTKYLTVSYQCQIGLDEIKEVGACSNTSVKLHCSRTHNYIAIYDVKLACKKKCSSMLTSGRQNCTKANEDIYNYVANKCNRQNVCVIPFPVHACCNHLQIQYICVPKKLLDIITPSKLDRFTKEVADSRDLTQTMTSQSVIDNNQAAAMSEQVTKYSSSTVLNILPNYTTSNFNLTTSFYFVNSFVQLMIYIKNNIDRALNVILGSIALSLLLIILLLLAPAINRTRSNKAYLAGSRVRRHSDESHQDDAWKSLQTSGDPPGLVETVETCTRVDEEVTSNDESRHASHLGSFPMYGDDDVVSVYEFPDENYPDSPLINDPHRSSSTLDGASQERAKFLNHDELTSVSHTASFPVHHTWDRPPSAVPTSAEHQYVSLASFHRESFYDNSLPRDFPDLYKEEFSRFVQPQLPGTRNLNQYYS